MKKNKILFISMLANKEHFTEFTNLSVAGVKYQIGLLNALNRRSDVELFIINFLPIPIFPNGYFYISKAQKSIENLSFQDLNYFNVPFLKSMTMKLSLEREINKISEVYKSWTIMSFNYSTIYRNLIKRKKNNHNVNYIPILADLPIKHSSKFGFFKNFIVTLRNRDLSKDLRQIENAILLNDNAAIFLSEKEKHIVIEGGVELNSKINDARIYSNEKIFIYSGTLDEYSGVNTMCEAFDRISRKYPEVGLEIYGFGDLESYVIGKSKLNKKIKYFGFINANLLDHKQKNCFCLVNPKIIEHPISIVTFPSKLHEYMLSNRPILSTKLKGISQDYFDNMFIVDGDSIEDFINGFEDVLNHDENSIRTKALNAFDFVTQEKNWVVQAERIIDFLNKLKFESN